MAFFQENLYVVRFVAAKAPQTNTIQQSSTRILLISKEDLQVGNLVPNQVKPLLETC